MGKMTLKIALALSLFVGPVCAMATTPAEALAATGDGKYVQIGDGAQKEWSITVAFASPLSVNGNYDYVWLHFMGSSLISTFFRIELLDDAGGILYWTELDSFVGRGTLYALPGTSQVRIAQKYFGPAGKVYLDAVTGGGTAAPGTMFASYLSSTGPIVAFPSNQSPEAAPDAGESAEAGLPVTFDVLTNDHDDDGDTLTITGVTQPANGTAEVTDNGTTVTYMSDSAYVGTDTFSYVISDGKGGTATAEVTVAVGPRHVNIDIKPGSYPNSINLGSNGVVPVAILSSAGFDATTVDPAMVSLAGADVAMRGKGSRYLASNQDVNGDGLLDLVLQVETENLDPAGLQNGYGTLVGLTYGGMPVIGADEITIVPQ